MLRGVSNESICFILILSLNCNGPVLFFAYSFTAHKCCLIAATHTLSHLSLSIYLPVTSSSTTYLPAIEPSIFLFIYIPSYIIRSSSSNPSMAPFLFLCNVIFSLHPTLCLLLFHIIPYHIISSHVIPSHITLHHVLSITYAYRQC